MNDDLKPKVNIFTDGCALQNPGRGGWAAILRCGEREKRMSGGFRHTTNNRMEMTAVAVALEALTRPSRVTVYSDSMVAVYALRDGGKKRRKKEPPNSDLRKRIFAAMEKHDVSAVWVKGHTGHPENEQCDKDADAAARALNLPEDAGYRAVDDSLFANGLTTRPMAECRGS